MVGDELVTRNAEFERSLDLISRSLGGVQISIPEDVLRRSRLKSDAMRLMAFGPKQDMAKAVHLLTEAITLEREQHASPAEQPGQSAATAMEAPGVWAQTMSRLCQLHILRAEANGSFVLKNLDSALVDLEYVMGEEPQLARVHVEKAKILRRSQRFAESIECFRCALKLAAAQKPPPEGNGLIDQLQTWVRNTIEDLEVRATAQGNSAVGDAAATDSGDGSGRWKVTKITGVSFDSCIYHLENSPPAIPHPYPKDSWHVSVHFGTTHREYTPISTASDWEKGRLDLLVKTYPEGIVSRKFATLQPWSVSKGACWVLVSPPHLTLTLPDAVDGKHRQTTMDALGCIPPATHVCLIVGGTGVAPALQILREVADPKGAFGPNCHGTLLYSSRRQWDVLALNELRTLESSAGGRVTVWHTLTDHVEAPADLESQATAEELRDRKSVV